jgi:hypothetical protein
MSSAAGHSAARGRRWSSPRALLFNRAASSQSRSDNSANNEGYTGSSETECKLSASRAPTVTPVKIVIAAPIANKASPLSPTLAITAIRPAVTKNGRIGTSVGTAEAGSVPVSG